MGVPMKLDTGTFNHLKFESFSILYFHGQKYWSGCNIDFRAVQYLNYTWTTVIRQA